MLPPLYPIAVFVCLPPSKRRCPARIIAGSYPNRTVIQLLKGVGKLYPFTCSDWERKNYRVFWKPKIKFPLTHLDKGGQNAHPKSVLCEKKLRKNLSFHLFPLRKMKRQPFSKKIKSRLIEPKKQKAPDCVIKC